MIKVITAVSFYWFSCRCVVQVPVLWWGPHWSRDCDDNTLYSKEVRCPSFGRLLCGISHQTPQSWQCIHAPHSGNFIAYCLPDPTALFADDWLISPGCVLIIGKVIWWTSTCQSLLGHHRQKHCRCNKCRRLYRHRPRYELLLLFCTMFLYVKFKKNHPFLYACRHFMCSAAEGHAQYQGEPPFWGSGTLGRGWVLQTTASCYLGEQAEGSG